MLKTLRFIAIPLSIGIASLTVNSTILSNKAATPEKNTVQIEESVSASGSATSTATKLSSSLGEIDLNNINSGIVKIAFSHSTDTKIKVEIKKDSNTYMYNLVSTNNFEAFPLQLGSGEYKVTLFKNISGTSYSTINTWTFNANVNSSSLYTSSNQLVNWDNSMNSITLAKQLTASCTKNDDKVKVLYDYILNNIKYNLGKTNLPSSYIPNIDSTLASKDGICFDFSSLFAAMLRSVGIQSKIVMGTSPNVNGYHCWNEVYLEKTNTFVTIDTSYDSQVKDAKLSYEMIKSDSLYSKDKEY